MRGKGKDQALLVMTLTRFATTSVPMQACEGEVDTLMLLAYVMGGQARIGCQSKRHTDKTDDVRIVTVVRFSSNKLNT